jgi:carboxyl-terminal processing protease
VLDLRNDPGGLLNAAPSAFRRPSCRPNATLVTSTDGRTADAKHQFYASPGDYLRGSADDYIKNAAAETRKYRWSC